MRERLTTRRIGLVCGALVLAALLFFFRGSDADAIRALLSEAERSCQISSREHPFEALEKTRALSRFVTEELDYALRFSDGVREGTISRAEAERKVSAGRTQLNSLEVKLGKPTVVVNGRAAEVALTVTALGSMPGAEGQFLEEHAVHLSLVKDSEWRVRVIRSESIR